jgi:hypothetical protein
MSLRPDAKRAFADADELALFAPDVSRPSAATLAPERSRKSLVLFPADAVEDLLGRFAHFRRGFFRVGTDFEADLMEWFGLNAGQARILAVLYAARGSVRVEAMMHAADVKRGSLNKYLPRIREALGEGALPEQSEGAYRLTQAGRAACDEAVANVGVAALRLRLQP